MKLKYLMAPEGDDAGGSGAGAAEPVAPVQAAPPPVDVSAVMARLEKMGETQNQLIQFIASQQQSQQRPAPRQEEQPLIDPDTENYVKKLVDQRVAGAEDMLDATAFRLQAMEMSLSDDEQKQVAEHHAMLKRNGVTINGRPATRQDAAMVLFGRVGLEQRQKLSVEQKTAAADRARRAANLDASVERGGREPENDNAGDPSSLSRAERLKDGGYWDKKLAGKTF